MKKFTMTIAVILLSFFGTLSLVACARVPDNYKDARLNLRENDYDVLVGTESDESIDVASGVLFELIYSLEDEEEMEVGETYANFLGEDELELEKDIEYAIAGLSENGEGKDFLLIIYFEDSKALATHYDDFVNVFEFLINNTFDSEVCLIENDDLEYGKSKNILYFGTAQALKDSK